MSDPCSIDIRVDDEGAWLDEGECSEYSCDYYHPDGHQFLIAPRSDRALALANIERLEAALAKVRAEAESWCAEHDFEETVEHQGPSSIADYHGLPTVLDTIKKSRTCRVCGHGGVGWEYIYPCTARGILGDDRYAICQLPKGHDGDHNGPEFGKKRPRVPDVVMELGLSESGDKVGNPPAKPEYG